MIVRRYPRPICKMCKTKLIGRSDKIFCTVKCKSEYHQKLKTVTITATSKIDKILHRNRSILLELMGKYKKQIKIELKYLDRKKFNFNYFTSRTINSRGKEYLHIYDFRYMLFSDNSILIVRK